MIFLSNADFKLRFKRITVKFKIASQSNWDKWKIQTSSRMFHPQIPFDCGNSEIEIYYISLPFLILVFRQPFFVLLSWRYLRDLFRPLNEPQYSIRTTAVQRSPIFHLEWEFTICSWFLVIPSSYTLVVWLNTFGFWEHFHGIVLYCDIERVFIQMVIRERIKYRLNYKNKA